jgi:hypothetical protein
MAAMLSETERSRLAERLELLTHDIRSALGPDFFLQVCDARDGSTLFGPDLAGVQEQELDEFESTDVVAFAGDHCWAVSTGGGVEDAVAQIATMLQDDVMDRTSRGWPEVYVERRFVALLIPQLRNGEVAWASENGRVVSPLGSLALASLVYRLLPAQPSAVSGRA